MEWSDELLEIYQRQILLKDVGIKGVENILDSKILVIGLGAIGCCALQYLASSGVGTIGILGNAKVETADISTQILYTFKDVGKPKLNVIKNRVKTINPNINVKTYKDSISNQNFANLVEIVRSYDIVLDCTDSFAPKILINAACVAANKILVHGGIVDLSLQILSIKPYISACYSCVYGVPKGFLDSINFDFKKKIKSKKNIESKKNLNDATCEKSNSTPTCAKSAMIGSIAGILGSMMVSEAIKILCNIKEPLYNSFLTLHTREMKQTIESIHKNPTCPICNKA